MFVPLPVPLVFQRSSRDFGAWRLKAPLPLRSSSGKSLHTLAFVFILSFTTHLHTRPSKSSPVSPPLSLFFPSSKPKDSAERLLVYFLKGSRLLAHSPCFLSSLYRLPYCPLSASFSLSVHSSPLLCSSLPLSLCVSAPGRFGEYSWQIHRSRRDR